MSTITIDDVLDVARTLDGRRVNPTALSPIGVLQSVYTAPDGRHCAVGEIGQRLGLAMPAWGDADNASPWPALAAARGYDVDPHAARLLAHIQTAADGGARWADAVGDWIAAGELGAFAGDEADRGGAT